MKQTLIKIIDDHYVVVDDSKIKEGDWVVGCTRTVVQCMYPENVHHRDVKKITHSTQPLEYVSGYGEKSIDVPLYTIEGFDKIQMIPLSEVKELIGEVDVEKKAELYVWGGVYLSEQEKQQTEIAYMTGYNQAIKDNKDRKYTEEDLRNAYRHGTTVNHGTKEHFNSFIQSFQSKTEWEVTFDEQGKLRLV